MNEQTTTPVLYTGRFFLLITASFFFAASFNMMIPELPARLTELGGAEYKGLLISLFTLTAGLSRPFSGKLADTVGRLPVMLTGGLVCIAAGFFYPLAATPFALLLLRFLHGFSTGFTPTGTSAYLADIVPDKRRGEGLGIMGVSFSAGMAAGPALGSWIADLYSFDIMARSSSAMAFLTVLVFASMPETLKNKQAFSPKLLIIHPKEIIDRDVIAPAVVLMLNMFAFGIILTLIPDFTEFLGGTNKGIFFSVFTLSSVGLRLFGGKLSDRMGRVRILRLSTAFLVVAVFVVGESTSMEWLIFSALLFGAATGLNSPTVYAWVVDLCRPEFRGRAMATAYIALEIGIGAGALISAAVYDNRSEMFPWAFRTGAVSSLIALIYLVFFVKKDTVKTD